MLRSYLKLAYRNFLRNKLSSFINLVGLSVAIGCSIVFFLMLDLEYTSDRFHRNAENIYMIGYTLKGDQAAQRWGNSPQPLGPALESDLAQVNLAVRVADRAGTVRYQDKVFSESIRFADRGFLDMFSFSLKLGDKEALANKNVVVLSERMAEKYFGKDNPIGQQLVIALSEAYSESFLVGGVAAEFPIQASFSFNILAAYDILRDFGERLDDWGVLTRATFIQVNSPADIPAIQRQMNGYVERQNIARVDRPIGSFIFEPLPTLSWQSQEIRNSISSGSTPQALILFFVIGMVLLTQACFNYVNITLATGSRRLKEIGIRKVSGSQRSQLVAQFLSENVLLCFSALIVGLLLTEFLFLPGMMQMTGSNQHISLLHFFGSPHIWIFFAIVLLLTGLGAGLYPALIVSRLQPASILKNKFGIGGKKRFTRLLLSFQFGIAFLIICLVTTFWRNNQYQRGQDWGYNQQHVINIELESAEQFEVMRNSIAQNSNVTELAGTVNTIGRTEQQAVVEVEALKHEVVRLDVGPGYLKTLGVRIEQGRLFDPDLSSDRDAALVVNELFVRQMGWTDAVGQSVKFDNRVYRVIGVVKNFHYDDFFHDIKSVMIRIAPNDQYRYLAVRVEADTGVQSLEAFEQSWRVLFPNSPFSAFFQDGVFDFAFRNNEGITRIFAAAATITLIISCMGLFGLVTLMIAKRMKEISIHKVLGASMSQVANLISRRFVLLVLSSTALAVPVGYVLLQNLLDAVYPYHMPLGLTPFVLAVSIVLLTAVMTIASQVYKATVRNPIDALRYE